MDLFDYMRTNTMEKEAPLASRMRPATLDEVVGQQHIIGKDKLLYRAIKADKLGSVIFYGPPGTGKTTLAKVIANTTSSRFCQINATVAGKKDMEDIVKEAKDALGMYGKKTILFVDEIHRFNKSQQDYLLPFVEDGTVTLIGATTENPYFEVNNALLSRSRIFELKPLEKQDIRELVLRAVYDEKKGMGAYGADITEDAADFLADVANGDARAALNAVELGILTTKQSEDGKVHIRAGASCIGQGLGTVLVQLVVTNAKLTRDQVVYDGNSTFITPDSGDTSGSRQTLVTGEACRRACLLLRDAMEYRSLSDLKGQEFYGEYYAKTNPLGANVPNPVSHVAYGYATQMCILDKETGKIKKMVAAHDVGKAINPLSCEGQIEGGVVMSMGYALTEQYPLDHGKPTAKYGTLGLFRSHQIPEIKAIVIDKPGLNLANGAIGIGEITSIPTAPAIAQAYYRYDGERRRSLPLDHTPYKK